MITTYWHAWCHAACAPRLLSLQALVKFRNETYMCWCCFYYSIGNSLLVLLETLFTWYIHVYFKPWSFEEFRLIHSILCYMRQTCGSVRSTHGMIRVTCTRASKWLYPANVLLDCAVKTMWQNRLLTHIISTSVSLTMSWKHCERERETKRESADICKREKVDICKRKQTSLCAWARVSCSVLHTYLAWVKMDVMAH